MNFMLIVFYLFCLVSSIRQKKCEHALNRKLRNARWQPSRADNPALVRNTIKMRATSPRRNEVHRGSRRPPADTSAANQCETWEPRRTPLTSRLGPIAIKRFLFESAGNFSEVLEKYPNLRQENSSKVDPDGDHNPRDIPALLAKVLSNLVRICSVLSEQKTFLWTQERMPDETLFMTLSRRWKRWRNSRKKLWTKWKPNLYHFWKPN